MCVCHVMCSRSFSNQYFFTNSSLYHFCFSPFFFIIPHSSLSLSSVLFPLSSFLFQGSSTNQCLIHCITVGADSPGGALSDGFVRSLNVPMGLNLMVSKGGEGVHGIRFGGEGCNKGCSEVCSGEWGIRSVRLSTDGFIVVQSVRKAAAYPPSLPSTVLSSHSTMAGNGEGSGEGSKSKEEGKGGGNGGDKGSGICSSALHLFTTNGTLLKSTSHLSQNSKSTYKSIVLVCTQ